MEIKATDHRKFTDALEGSVKLLEIKRTCESLYGDRWEKVKADAIETLKIHQQATKSSSLLSSAIAIAKDTPDDRIKMVLFGAAIS